MVSHSLAHAAELILAALSRDPKISRIEADAAQIVDALNQLGFLALCRDEHAREVVIDAFISFESVAPQGDGKISDTQYFRDLAFIVLFHLFRGKLLLCKPRDEIAMMAVAATLQILCQ